MILRCRFPNESVKSKLFLKLFDTCVKSILIYGSEFGLFFHTLRKHAYSNILKILPRKNEKKKKNQIKSSEIFHKFAQNTDCGYSLEPPRRSSSNQYPQSMFLSRNKLLYINGV